MIVKTRYRDIPWEEARKCYRLSSRNRRVYPEGRGTSESWERAMRGKPVSIIVPARTDHQYKYVRCEGPFFTLADSDNKMVCPHIAEIGD